MQLVAVGQLPCEITSSESLLVVGETAPSQGQGKQAGGFLSMGQSWGFSWKRVRAY